MSAQAAQAGGGPGDRLRAARERRGLGIEQVAESLRLESVTVQALESGDYARIGAPVFVRGFLRRYADLVGEPAGEIELMYRNQPESLAQPDLAGTGLQPVLRPREPGRLGVRSALLATIVLALVAGVWWAMRAGPRAHVAAMPAATTATAPEAGQAGAPAAAPASAAGAAASAPSSAATNAEAAPAALPPLPRKVLELAFAGDSWAEVYDARGYRLYFGFGHAGDALQWKGVPPFRLVLGNASVVTARYEGSPVELPPSPPDVRQRLLLAASGEVTAAR